MCTLSMETEGRESRASKKIETHGLGEARGDRGIGRLESWRMS